MLGAVINIFHNPFLKDSSYEERKRTISRQCQEDMDNHELDEIMEYCIRPEPTSKIAAAVLPVAADSSDKILYEELIIAQQRDHAYLFENFKTLLKKFRGKYVAIRNEEVVDSDRNLLRLLNRVRTGENDGKRYFIEKIDKTLPVVLEGPNTIVY